MLKSASVNALIISADKYKCNCHHQAATREHSGLSEVHKVWGVLQRFFIAEEQKSDIKCVG